MRCVNSERVEAEGRIELLREIYADWSFFKTFMDFMRLILANSET